MRISGIGRTKFGALKESLVQLAYEAMSSALWDADVQAKELDAVYVSNFIAGEDASQLHFNSVIAGLLGVNIPVIRVETACASGGTAIFEAANSRYENVLVVGAEKMTSTDSKLNGKNIGLAGDRELDQQEGLIFPASYALIAQQHMLKYGTTTDDLALVALKNHDNARLNPLAHFSYKDVTLSDIKKSEIVASPLRLYDCSPITDGAAALVLTKKKKEKSVSILGISQATDYISLSQRKELTTFQAAKDAAKKAYAKAGKATGQASFSLKQINLAEVHDCFTIAELVAMEDLGFAAPGKAAQMVREGMTKLTGELPINTDGGLKADGHPIGASGVAQACEIVLQLRGQAGKRQVKGAEVGLCHNVGGVGGTAVVSIFSK